MERADEPTEEGTPINKALFDSIQSELHGKIDNKYVAGSFSCDASANVTINVGFKPKLVIVNSGLGGYYNSDGYVIILTENYITTIKTGKAETVTANGFTYSNTFSDIGFTFKNTTPTTVTVNYIAFR